MMINDKLQEIVNEQAEDEGLWFHAQSITEGYLQQELRRLHKYIENRGEPLSSHAVPADVRAELLHDAMSLLMNHEQHEDEGWKKEYEELIEKYSKHFS